MMAGKEPRLLGELMAPGSGRLGQLAVSARRHCDLAGHLKAVLDPGPAEALLAASLRDDGTLVLTATSAAWATRLRFDAERLLLRARELLPDARRLKVRVLPGCGPAPGT